MTCNIRDCNQYQVVDGECYLSTLPKEHGNYREPQNCSHKIFKDKQEEKP
jgi:hypothetical protein